MVRYRKETSAAKAVTPRKGRAGGASLLEGKRAPSGMRSRERPTGYKAEKEDQAW